MVEEQDQFDNGNPKPNIEKEKRKKTKQKKQLVKETPLANEKVEEEVEEEENEKPNKRKDGSIKSKKKKKKKKHLLKENFQSVLKEKGALSIDEGLVQGKKDRKNQSLVKADKGEEGEEEEDEVIRTSAMEEENPQSNDDKADIKKKKRKRRLLKEAAEADKRGICYLSRIPPHMDPFKLRQILSQFGDIQRIYLTPESN